MNELKRPNDLDFEYTKDYIRAMDSFLLACAFELERARKLREKNIKLLLEDAYENNISGFKKASQIENEVIEELKGDKK